MRLPRHLVPIVSILLAVALFAPSADGAGPAKPAAPSKPRADQPPRPEMAPELRQRVEETLAEALASRDALAQGTALAAQVDLGDAAASTRVEEALAEENWGIKR
ncbi:MAG: hypothetical protein FJ125_11240, partial [Deltaproteobacteria bacterium]|nr:hypothetical protein [Deltaproteobacteria bacterium]